MSIVFTACGFPVIFFVIVITAFLLYSGLPAIGKIGICEFLFGTTWASTAPNSSYGILPFILSSVYGTLGAIIIGVPIGILCAVFIAKAANKRLAAFVRSSVDLLSGIPSVIYGLVGMLVFVQFCSLGTSILAGALTLVIMTLPTIMRTTQESLKTVPDSYRENALALGSGKWHMIRTVVLPSSIDGIVTGCILSIGRIVGESAALLFTAGMANEIMSFTDALMPSHAGSTLTVALYMYAKERGEFDIAFAIAAILLVLTFVINLAAKLTAKFLKKKGDK